MDNKTKKEQKQEQDQIKFDAFTLELVQNPDSLSNLEIAFKHYPRTVARQKLDLYYMVFVSMERAGLKINKA